jgi:hypothetical protein
MVQPASVIAVGGIPASGSQSSYYMYSDPWLVR